MSCVVQELSAAFPVDELVEVDSTNSEALRRAASGQRGPVWILAQRQSAGRGRSGRSWSSAEGNLAATLLLAPGCPVSALHQLSLITGVAAFDALRELIAAGGSTDTSRLRLKWPNDVLLEEAKLGGILIESTTVAGGVVAAIGIGINIGVAPSAAGRTTAAVGQLVANVTPRVLLTAIDQHLRRLLAVWNAGGGFSLIRMQWLERAGRIGEPIEVNTGKETIRGVFAGIDETGALLVDSVRGQLHDLRRITFGDVSLLPRKAEGSS